MILSIATRIYGAFFRYIYGINGGKKLHVYKGFHINHRRKGAIYLGERVRFYHDVGIYIDSPHATVRIGDHTYINRRTEIRSQEEISIGKECAISWDVAIMDSDYHSISHQSKCKKVTIGDHVWIGCKSTILKGVTIGDGAVIAAGSVVNTDIPPKSLWGGIPARLIKTDVEWE